MTVAGGTNDNATPSFLVTATGALDDVVSMLVDKAADNDNHFIVVGKDPQTAMNAGMHPWQSASGNQALVVVFNHEQRPESVQLRIGTVNGGVWQKTIPLLPHQTYTATVDALIRDEVPDDKKLILPKTLEKGEISWFTPENHRVTGRLMQMNASDHLIQNFSCYGQIVLCEILATATPSSGDIGIQFHFTSQGLYCTTNYGGSSVCSGPQTSNGPGGSFSWATNGSFQNGSSSNYDAYAMSVSAGNGYASVTETAGSCTATGSAPVSVGPQPDHIIVQADAGSQTLNCSSGYTQQAREVDYQVLSSGLQQVTQLISVFETVDPNTVSSCTRTKLQNVTPTYTQIQNGFIADHLNAGCPNYNNSGCGFTAPSQSWEACLNGSNKNLGTIGKLVILSNSINLCGNTTMFTKGQSFPH